ncbi:MAG: DUF6766 family protein [Bacteroidota bacterium]
MPSHRNHSFLYRNGLSIAVLSLMLLFWALQFYTGWHAKNEELEEDGFAKLDITQYLNSGHFVQATFENWESEFLQMALYVLLTIKLRQKGSSESKKLTGTEEVDREPKAHPNAPSPVIKGGWRLRIYENSLSIAFALLFLISFVLHFYGSFRDQNQTALLEHKPLQTWQHYMAGSRFWFESFQNWQSEFLAVASIVILSIWLRQKGSPESKPVDAPHYQTGD